MSDRGGETADGGELFGIAQGLLGPLAISDVDAENDDSGDGAVRLAARLIDEIETALLQRLAGATREIDGISVGDERSSGPVDVVENVEESLLLCLGECFAN